jgi:hypothetical protein
MNKTKHQEFIEETELLIRSKRTILYMVTQEESRILSTLESICSKVDPNWDLIKWDVVTGLHSNDPEFLPAKKESLQLDQEEVLKWFEELIVPKNKFVILVLKDFNKFFGTNYSGQLENRIIRYLKNLSSLLNVQNKAIIILSNFCSKVEDSSHLTVIVVGLLVKLLAELYGSTYGKGTLVLSVR